MSAHSAIQFQFDHPDLASEWYKNSNYLCLLAVSNEEELQRLIGQATLHNIRFSVFREPDIDNQIAAIALAPHPKSKKLCSNLRLALKE